MAMSIESKRRHNILMEITAERNYQDQKWGHEVDDLKNTPWMWTAYITQYASKWMIGRFIPLGTDNIDTFRAMMVKVAAIAIAAIESVDRQRILGGKAFYE
jgi:hypothetical protein